MWGNKLPPYRACVSWIKRASVASGNFFAPTQKGIRQDGLSLYLMPWQFPTSRMGRPHTYHRRYGVSLLSS
ncbi:hypothetical protein, partial [Escherichia coli]|uniref:hypothetical protein n=1 Tax=Escherichia coli TaxID=562 RepID=UPI001BFC7BF8